MQLRVARHTERLDEVVAFYRDGIGLGEIGGFRDHDGYDGVFLAVPGTGAHLELTAGGGHGAPAPHPESLLVLYLGDDEAVQSGRGASRRRSGRSRQPVLGRARGDVPGPGRLPSRPRARALGVVAAGDLRRERSRPTAVSPECAVRHCAALGHAVAVGPVRRRARARSRRTVAGRPALLKTRRPTRGTVKIRVESIESPHLRSRRMCSSPTSGAPCAGDNRPTRRETWAGVEMRSARWA